MKLNKFNFKISSKGWKKIPTDVGNIKINPEGDIWEHMKGPFKGKQLFTFDAMIRETKKAGKRVPTLLELELEGMLNVPARICAGTFRFGSVGAHASYTPQGEEYNANFYWSSENQINFPFGFMVRCVK